MSRRDIAHSGEYASMSPALFGISSEQATFALLIALGLFFLYLQLQRFARLARRDDQEPPDDTEEERDNRSDPQS